MSWETEHRLMQQATEHGWPLADFECEHGSMAHDGNRDCDCYEKPWIVSDLTDAARIAAQKETSMELEPVGRTALDELLDDTAREREEHSIAVGNGNGNGGEIDVEAAARAIGAICKQDDCSNASAAKRGPYAGLCVPHAQEKRSERQSSPRKNGRTVVRLVEPPTIRADLLARIERQEQVVTDGQRVLAKLLEEFDRHMADARALAGVEGR